MVTAKNLLGQRAIVLGAGIAGSLVARVLADHFAEVTVIERDGAPDAQGYRKGVPQARLVHGLLRGGLDAINTIYPGFEADLYACGAVRAKPARDLLFVDGLGVWPQPDVGFEVPWSSRPLIERCLRAQLARVPNVELREHTSARGLVAEAERIVGVHCVQADGSSVTERGDLIVDASGRAAHTGAWLTSLGFPAPEETRVDVDITYACCFVRPTRNAGLGALVIEPPPSGRYGCLVQAQEGERLIVGILGRGTDADVPRDFAGVLACAERLPHPGAFELIRDAEPLTPVARFGFPSSVQRHYERLTRLPEGFVCIGDAICSFNPIWGQGMSVAALQVVALAELLNQRAQQASAPAPHSAGFPGLAPAFYAAAARIVAVAWQLSVVPDYAFETTRGERPPGISTGRGFMRALAKLAMQEPEVRVLTNEVFNMIKPLDALRAPELVAKVLPLLSNAGASG